MAPSTVYVYINSLEHYWNFLKVHLRPTWAAPELIDDCFLAMTLCKKSVTKLVLKHKAKRQEEVSVSSISYLMLKTVLL